LSTVNGDVVIVEKKSGIAWITLNRPQALNAINDEVRRALPAAVSEADADPSVRVMVISGAGPRGFCAGADIKEFAKVDSLTASRQRLVHDGWVNALDRARKPIIASIHGFCLGGGLEMAVACDIRIASKDAVLGYPEVGLGLITGAGGSQQLLRIVGLGRALDLFLTTEKIPAEEAYRIGLITRMTAPESLKEETERLAEHIANLPPAAVVFAKEAMRQGAEMDIAAGKKLEASLFGLLLSTKDRLEAAEAFKQKRKPVFRGE